MATGTYEAISTTTVPSNTTVLTISGIPATYTDLRIIMAPKATAGSNAMRMRVNNDSGNNYNIKFWSATPSSTSVGAQDNNTNQITAGNYTNMATALGRTIYIMDLYNYTSANLFKRISIKSATATNNVVDQTDALWKNSSTAINRLDFNIAPFGSSTGDFMPGTTVAIYGIKAW
jgi:hypothetical protein